MAQPTALVISGPPGSGKSTLASLLAERLAWPIVSRDAMKAGLAHALRLPSVPVGHPVNVDAYRAMYAVGGTYLAAGVSVIIENAFRADIAGDELRHMTEGASARMVFCNCPKKDLLARCRQRSELNRDRRTAHPDDDNLTILGSSTFDWTVFEPIRLDGPILRVDTASGYDPSFDEICAFAST